MSIGILILSIVTILILFGFAHTVLDRMRLNDKTAILFLVGMVVGTFIPNIPLGNRMSINIGGAIIPIILCVYLLIKAGTTKERMRAVIASLVSATIIFFMSRFFTGEEYSTIFSDPFLIYGVVGGLVAYLIGRSRRSSFIAGIMGIVLADIAQVIANIANNVPTNIKIGGAGVVDATVISGIIAVLLAEFIGEAREKMQGGTDKKHMTFKNSEFASTLGEDNVDKDNTKKKDEIDDVDDIDDEGGSEDEK